MNARRVRRARVAPIPAVNAVWRGYSAAGTILPAMKDESSYKSLSNFGPSMIQRGSALAVAPAQGLGDMSDTWEGITAWAADYYGTSVETIVNRFKAAAGKFLQNGAILERNDAMIREALARGEKRGTLTPQKRAELLQLLGTVQGNAAQQRKIEGEISGVTAKLRQAGILPSGQLGIVVVTAIVVTAIAGAVAVAAVAYALTASVRSTDRQVELAAAGQLTAAEIASIKGGLGGGLAALGGGIASLALLAGGAFLFFKFRGGRK